MTKNRKRLLAVMLLIAVMVCSSFSVAAAAKKTVKKCNFTTSTATAQKKAATVKKGTTMLTFKGGHGYIRFKAPKTKTYSFTFSNVKDKKKGACAYVEMMKVVPKTKYSKSYITMTKVSTAGGKSTTLWLSVNGRKFSGKGISRPIASRTGKMKLKKGQVVYLYFSNGSAKTTAKLNIK